MYSEKVMDHFRNPRNIGSIENPDGIGEVGNPRCGDVMRFYIKVKAGKIERIGFETMGCVAAIATSSVLSELALGKSLTSAQAITRESVAKALSGLPQIKMHCSNLAVDALRAAIDDYERGCSR